MASGNRPSTGPKPKGSGAGKAEKLSQKEQSERFKQTARDLGIEDSSDAFEAAMDRIAGKRGSRVDE